MAAPVRLGLSAIVLSCLSLAVACSSNTGTTDQGSGGSPSTDGGSGGTSTGGHAGTSGSGGTSAGGFGGSSTDGAAGGAGNAGTAGAAGAAGSGGTAGAGGVAGNGGSASSGTTGGSAGAAGLAEDAGDDATAEASDDATAEAESDATEAGQEAGCVPQPEVCDGVDNDCNGSTDDGPALCDDGYYCNGAEVCFGKNGCSSGQLPDCSDAFECTTDSCDTTVDACVHMPISSVCDDGKYCNGVESCDAANGCVAGQPPSCADGVDCTADTCSVALDSCLHLPDSAKCTDGKLCNGEELCDAVAGCVSGPLPGCSDGDACTADVCDVLSDSCASTLDTAKCDDGIPCTSDTCDPATGGCSHAADDTACADANACNGVEKCDVQAGCVAGVALHCDDGKFCNGAETCDSANGCKSGLAPSCDDGISCTVDSCDAIAGACVHTPTTALCDNGVFCDGAETCDAVLGCQAGTSPDCADAVGCTHDTCDATTDACAHTNVDSFCSDGKVCNGPELCDPVQGAAGTGCRAGTALNCSDGIPCTLDACAEPAGCTHTPQNSTCDDGTYCNGQETCSAQFGCQSGSSVMCNDSRTCTTDTCSEVLRSCLFTLSAAACDDGLFCNGQESCSSTGSTPTGCVPGIPPSCPSDGISCTLDACDEVTNACLHTADNTLCAAGQSCVVLQNGCTSGMPCATGATCQDGNLCNGVELCDAGICKPGIPVNCNDGFSCTADACNPSTGACAHSGDSSKCSDGLYCTGVEVCDPTAGAAGTGCKAGALPACDDGVSCTVDSCNETQGCVHTATDSLCSNGTFCDGAEACDAVLGCRATTPPSCTDGIACTDDYCDVQTDACAHYTSDTKCSDGLICNGSEVCDPPNGAAGTGCKAGVALPCDDKITCTFDACSEALKGCTHTPESTACDDGMFCNGPETCNAQVGCQSGSPPSCDDNRSCTQDTCSEAIKFCLHTAVDAACDDGLFCNGVETCNAAAPAPTGCSVGLPILCASDGISCTVDACTETAKACEHLPDNQLCPSGQFCVLLQNGCTAGTPCLNGVQCQDGNLCNGVEVCTLGICRPGTPVDCSDGVSCTVDACTPGTGACSHTAEDTLCDNGYRCDGLETCNPANGCVAGTPITCNDGVTCTLDQCEEPSGTCGYLPFDYLCADGNVCNGSEVCSPTLGCQPGAAFTCPDDGIACTTQVCDPVLNGCKPVPHSSLCPCGQTCSATFGCGNFCTQRTCQGKVYACGDCADNDGDCRVDSDDSQCLGPCDNTEDSYYGGIPGQNNSPCKSDCYFDQDTGAGNDDCYWSHACDPLEVAPSYPPEGTQCAYDPSTNIPGFHGSCSQAFSTQSSTCLGYCGPLTPNGCDCFGCCAIPGAPTTVWLGSENPSGTGSCSVSTVGNASMCKPCTQVSSCLNTCEKCELCIGKTELPPECVIQVCPSGTTPCGLPSQDGCPVGFSCITGCCQAEPG